MPINADLIKLLEYERFYDSGLVKDSDYKMYLREYTTSLKRQAGLTSIFRLKGTVSDMLKNNKLLYDYKIPSPKDTLILPLDYSVLLHFVEGKHLRNLSKENSIYGLTDINSNSTLFTSQVFFAIDGGFRLDVSIALNKQKPFLILDFKRITDAKTRTIFVNRIIRENSPWELIMIPFEKSYKKYTSLYYLLDKQGHIPLANIEEANTKYKEDEDGQWIIYTSKSAADSGKLSQSNITLDMANNKFVLDPDYLKYYKANNSIVDLYISKTRNLKEMKICKDGERWFYLTLEDHPVPVENIFVFAADTTNKYYTYLHDIEIVQKYPNVYHLTNVPDEITDVMVMVKYFKNIEFKFNNELERYINYMGYDTFLDKYKTNTHRTPIESYTPSTIEFGINDFIANHMGTDSLEYNHNKFKELYPTDLKAFKDYLVEVYNKTNTLTKSYLIFVNETDINDRECMNNHNEVTVKSSQANFDEPHTFIKVTSSRPRSSAIRLWIDGNRVPDIKVFYEKFMEYVYIPKRLVNEDSVIEIERLFLNTPYSFKMTFNDTTSYVALPEGYGDSETKNILINRIDTKEYVDSAKFMAEVTGEYGTIEVPLDSLKTLNYSGIKLKLTDATLVGVELNISTSKDYKKVVKIYPEDNSFVEGQINGFDRNTNKMHHQVFINGQMAPYNIVGWRFMAGNKIGDDIANVLIIGELDEPGERTLTCEYLPYEYKIVYTTKKVDNEKGLIDLTGSITRPFDLRYYDVYANGRKLNITNVNVLSENLIQLYNVRSLRHVYIFEKFIDNDPFEYKGNYTSLDEELLKVDTDYLESLLKPYPITDTDNHVFDITEEVLNEFDRIMNIYMMIPLRPDMPQIFNDPRRVIEKDAIYNDELYALAETEFVQDREGNNILMVNPDKMIDLAGFAISSVIHYNPDDAFK